MSRLAGMRLPGILALLSMVMLQSGCFFDFDDDDCCDEPPVARPANQSPSVQLSGVPHWPPAGPDTVFTMVATDDRGLTEMEITFRNSMTLPLSGTGFQHSVTGQELGEGFGTLGVRVTDTDGRSGGSFVTDLLIDLSPPELSPGATVVRHAPDSFIELWVADAWILGRVELHAGGVTLTQQFDAGYPSTLGESWDHSLVQFATTDLPEGVLPATIVATDAAGNATELELELDLDGQAPAVAITQPASNATVSGLFDVALDASDMGGGPVWVEVMVNGAPVANAVGPSATVQLNADDFTPGLVELQAIASDTAGNESQPASITLTIQ